MQVAPGRVGTDEDRQVQAWHEFEDTRVPFLGEALARGQVAASSSAGEVEVHGDDRDLARVVERLPVDTHPVAQPVAAAVIPRDAALFGDAPGSLADDHDATSRVRVEQRFHPTRCVRGVGRVGGDRVGDRSDGRVGDLGGHAFRVGPPRANAPPRFATAAH